MFLHIHHMIHFTHTHFRGKIRFWERGKTLIYFTYVPHPLIHTPVASSLWFSSLSHLGDLLPPLQAPFLPPAEIDRRRWLGKADTTIVALFSLFIITILSESHHRWRRLIHVIVLHLSLSLFCFRSHTPVGRKMVSPFKLGRQIWNGPSAGKAL